MSPLQTTSSARPAAPWEGQTIYDTDTNIGYQYDGTNFAPTYPGSGFRNLIINGGMQVNQRATAVTSLGYVTDRWYYENYGSSSVSVASNTDAPAGQGFTASLRATTTTGASASSTDLISIVQKIEGLNSAHLAFGTASAKTVTLSFWVRSSVVGIHTVNLENDGSSRIYIGTYSIAVANTWEKKTVTIAGDTTGTWLTTNSTGVQVRFPVQVGPTLLGAGNVWVAGSYQGITGTVNDCATTGNIFAITGVQLEANPQATPFEQRPYGTELALCQRYYYKIDATRGTTNSRIGTGFVYNTTAQVLVNFPVEMRTSPTHENSTPVGNFQVYNGLTAVAVTSFAQDTSSPNNFNINIGLGSAMTTNGAQLTRNVNATPCFFAFTAEL